MALTPGTRLGVYDITAQIGEGGMGQVYRATDTKLKRQVAIKILPPSLAADPDRLARFQREAEVLASLNQPNIAAIYGLEESAGITALVMELVEGDDLSQRIARGAISIEEALPIAKQIAEALEAAHEQGIIHRDLKPANIKVRDDGTVKVLDFGLAKALDPAGSSSMNAMNSPTLSMHATMQGVILGTAAYMAPEQARGKPIDKRADIWAFGVVLFEMLAGRRAFEGEDVSDTLAAILRGEPDWRALPPGTPPHVRRVLEQCLQRDRKRRLRDIGDVQLALDQPDAAVSAPVAPPARVVWRARLAWLAALVIISAAVGVGVWWLRTPAPTPETRLDVTTPPTSDPTFAISPDGRQLVFVAPSNGQRMIWLRPLDTTAARPLPGTEDGTNPFWSPDNKSIGFFAVGQLKRLDLAGGAPQLLGALTIPGHGGAWAVSGIILYKRPGGEGGLVRIPASGGEGAVVTKPQQGQSDVQPQFLPDGRQFIFFRNGLDNVRGIYLGSLDDAQVTRLTDADAAGRFIVPGWLTYIRQGTLVARRFDVTHHALSGDPVSIAEVVPYDSVASRRAGFSVSSGGVIAYRIGLSLRQQLTWFDHKGTVLGTLGPVDEDSLSWLDLSPDGRRAAVYRSVAGNGNIWLIDALRTARFTFGGQGIQENFPLWSPDGSRIGYMKSSRGARLGEYVRSSSGAASEQPLTQDPMLIGMTSWSRDGRFILVDRDPVDIWVIPTEPGRKPFPFIDGTPYRERAAQFSPDGRWVAYESNESGRTEIYVRPFSGSGPAAPAAGQWQVSTAGGAQARWSPDGKWLYWVAPDSKLMTAAIVVTGATVEPGAPVVLFPTRIPGGWNPGARAQYAVAPDGRFLINTLVDEASSPPITIVQHWRGFGR